MLISSNIELLNVNNQLLKEDFNKTGKLILRDMVLQRANAENKNGRIYPREILEREVTKYNNEYVLNRKAYGELDHTDNTVVEMKTASHMITRIYWDNDTVKGDVEIFHETPTGSIVKNLLLNHNCQLGISSRAGGTTYYNRELGVDVVNDDLDLICWDLVSDPSTHGAHYQINEANNKALNKLNNINNLLYDVITGLSC